MAMRIDNDWLGAGLRSAVAHTWIKWQALARMMMMIIVVDIHPRRADLIELNEVGLDWFSSISFRFFAAQANSPLIIRQSRRCCRSSSSLFSVLTRERDVRKEKVEARASFVVIKINLESRETSWMHRESRRVEPLNWSWNKKKRSPRARFLFKALSCCRWLFWFFFR